MTAILGIDAAWTATQPSGIALVSSEAGRWRVTFAGSSYGHLMDRAAGRIPSFRPSGSVAEAAAVLAAAEQIAAAPIDFVAVDMPLSPEAIAERRVPDNLVSKAYGARHCSTHTPSPIRPGRISDNLRTGFSGDPFEPKMSAARSCSKGAKEVPYGEVYSLSTLANYTDKGKLASMMRSPPNFVAAQRNRLPHAP